MRFTVKKPTVETLADSLQEIETEFLAYRNMLEIFFIARKYADLRIVDGNQIFLRLAEHWKIVRGVGNTQQLVCAATC